MTLELFSLGDVAKILDMPPTQVKNWTIGRPFKVDPVVRASGIGTRNIYSRENLYTFALIQALHKSNFRASAIIPMLRSQGDYRAVWKWELIEFGDFRLHVKSILKAVDEKIKRFRQIEAGQGNG